MSASSSKSRHKSLSCGLDRLAAAGQVDPLLFEVLQAGGAVGALLGLLRLAGRPGEHALGPDVHVGQLDARDR